MNRHNRQIGLSTCRAASQQQILWRSVVGVVGSGAIALLANSAWADALTQWRYDPKTNNLEVTLKEGIEPRYFLMAQPARIVVDLPSTSVGQLKQQETYNGAVRQVRIAQYDANTTRIVLELAPDVVLAPGQVKLQRVKTPDTKSDRWVVSPLIAQNTAPAEPGQSDTPPRSEVTPAPETIAPAPVPSAAPQPTAPQALPWSEPLPVTPPAGVAKPASPPTVPPAPVAPLAEPPATPPAATQPTPAPAVNLAPVVPLAEPLPTPAKPAEEKPRSSLVLPSVQTNDGVLEQKPVTSESPAPSQPISTPSPAPITPAPTVSEPQPAPVATPQPTSPAIAPQPVPSTENQPELKLPNSPVPQPLPTAPNQPSAPAVEPPPSTQREVRSTIPVLPAEESLSPTPGASSTPVNGTVAPANSGEIAPQPAPTAETSTNSAVPPAPLPAAPAQELKLPLAPTLETTPNSQTVVPVLPVDMSKAAGSDLEANSAAGEVPAKPLAPVSVSAKPLEQAVSITVPPPEQRAITNSVSAPSVEQAATPPTVTAPPPSPVMTSGSAPTAIAPVKPFPPELPEVVPAPANTVSAPIEIPEASLPAVAQGTQPSISVPPLEPLAEPAPGEPMNFPAPEADSGSLPPAVSVPPLQPAPTETEFPGIPETPTIPQTNSQPAVQPTRVAPAAPNSDLINFGQPLPASQAAQSFVLPKGTILSLRYPNNQSVQLKSGKPQQEVLLVAADVRDRSGNLLIPAGAPVTGRFETSMSGSRFVTQAIAISGQTIPLVARSDAMAGNRKMSEGTLVRNIGIGSIGGALVSDFSGYGMLGGAAVGAAATYLTAPKPATLQPNQVIQVELAEPFQR
ncbi:MAG TPA: AMIN domain-containing protein [Leptolyngbyaceae cyanobacterium M33_DOE_097]|uniref:AMIN domain-containing protein n=1 Tax=Oscillatoriales cyanobacterium SpSt-418 TaxID=2282169 RepID=A0A7C3PI46_9CYAN|nr:AMIN domain-containing protein [Leptolyngbyaceae cyanobacterium M33_DOE_097]